MRQVQPSRMGISLNKLTADWAWHACNPVRRRKRRQEAQEHKVVLIYTLTLRSAWDTGTVTSKNKLSCQIAVLGV